MVGRRLLRRGIAQHQHGLGNAPQPQLQGLFQIGDSKPVRPQGLKFLGHAHRPMAVGVRFHHAAHFGIRIGRLPHSGKIPGQGVQVDFRPGSSKYFFHI